VRQTAGRINQIIGGQPIGRLTDPVVEPIVGITGCLALSGDRIQAVGTVIAIVRSICATLDDTGQIAIRIVAIADRCAIDSRGIKLISLIVRVGSRLRGLAGC